MKRSEMLEMISDSVLKSEHLYHLGKIKAKAFSKQLLTVIEEAGMLPPPKEHLIKRDWGSYLVDGEREWDEER